MNIHFIASTIEGGGAERVLVLLANEFVVRGHKVSIVTMMGGQSYELHSSINRIELHSGFRFNHTIRSFLNLFKFYNKVENRPDVGIAFMPRMGLISILICKFYRIPIITSEHNNHLRETPLWIRFTWNYIYRLADAITVLTDFDKNFFEQKKARVVVMPNPSTFKSISKKVSRKKVILAVGGLDRIYHKGFDNLLNLIPQVLKKHPDWHLIIAGGGSDGLETLKEIAKEQGIIDKVTFPGFISNVNELMQTSEIFVLPSRYEGLPMVLLEAMSQGMACISYNCITGPSEIITHELNGLLIEDQNQLLMVEGLNRLIEDGNLRKKLQQAAPLSLNKFSMENIMQRWENLFSDITNRK